MLLGVPAAGELKLWPSSDDLLQDAIDAHGLALTTMGYPLEYVSEVVTPGVDLDDYLDDGFKEERNTGLLDVQGRDSSLTQE